MTKYCVVCQKDFISGNHTRHFFKFPANDEAKKKWLNAIGKSYVGKYAHICSDHFAQDSFHASKKRLLPEAVPLQIVSTKQVLGEVGNETVSNDHTIRETDKSSMQHSSDAACMIPVSNDVELICDQGNASYLCEYHALNDTLGTNVFQDNDQDVNKSLNTVNKQGTKTNNVKRKLNMLDHKTVVSNKKIRFQFNNQTEHISKADFVSHEAWLRFLRFNIVKSRQAGKHRLQKCRLQKKICQMKQLISELEQREEYTAAEALEGLPEHVKELITRMIEKKHTAPFSAHLKDFALTLYLHSPAGYEFVRQSFSKCLPRMETLNKWVCSKDYEPSLSEEIVEYVSVIVEGEAEDEATEHEAAGEV